MRTSRLFRGRSRNSSETSSITSTSDNPSLKPPAAPGDEGHGMGRLRVFFKRSLSRSPTRPEKLSSTSVNSLVTLDSGSPDVSGKYLQQHRPSSRSRSPSISYSLSSSVTLIEPPSLPVTKLSPPASEPSYPDSVWAKALLGLSEEDRKALNFGSLDDKLDIINNVVEAVAIKRKLCIDKQWKFTYKGEKIILRDVADKLLAWVEKFKLFGDIIVQYDPVHAALPWAGFRFLLQLAVDDSQKMGTILVGLEKIAVLIDRCALYEKLYLGKSLGLNSSRNLEKVLTLLYSAILTYLSRAKQFYAQNTAVRIASGIFDTGGFEPLLNAIQTQDDAVFKAASVTEAEYQSLANKENRDEMEKLRNILHEFEKPIMRIDSKVAAIFDGLRDSERTEILLWVSRIPYKKHHERAKEGRLHSTGDWLLQKGAFKQWQVSSISNILWLHGIPGAGKTKLTSLVVDFLLAQLEADNDEGFAYFYCNRNETERQDPDTIFRAILKQLSYLKTGVLHAAVVEHYNTAKLEGFSSGDLGIHESADLILQLLNIYPKTTIIIDALDECDPKLREDLFEALERILTLAPNLVKIFVSSRDDADITHRYAELPNLYIEANDNADDINRFVQSQISECIQKRKLLNGKVSSELKELICTTLSNDANGMFLWVDLQIKDLCDLSLESDVRTRLGKLPDTLEETYAEIFEKKIGAEKGNGPLLADRAMMWIMCSSVALSPEKLITGAVLGLQLATDSPKASYVDLEVILKLCHNLVVLDHQLDVMRFVHLSVQEYLEKRRWDAVVTNTMAAEVCVYLLNDPQNYIFWGDEDSNDSDDEEEYEEEEEGEGEEEGEEEGDDEESDENDDRGDDEGEDDDGEDDGDDDGDDEDSEYGFRPSELYHYSLIYWQDHFKNCDDGRQSKKLPALLRKFLGSFNKAGLGYINWYESINPPKEIESDPPCSIFGAALYGLGEVVDDLWDGNINPNLTNLSNESVLYIASKSGHEWVVKRLLELGAPVSIRGGFFGDPLQGSTSVGSELVAKLLIEHGAEVNTDYGYFGDPLQGAAWYGFEGMARLFLKHGAKVNTQHGYWGSPLQAAADTGHERLARLLLKHGADVNMPGGQAGSPLHAAASSDCVKHDKMVRMLIKEGADIHATWNNVTVLQAAAFQGRKETVHLLLSKMKANKSQIASVAGSSAACAAVLANSLGALRDIVEAGGEINTPSPTTLKTALHHALELRSRPIIEYLISQIPSLQLLGLNLKDVRRDDIDWAQNEPWFHSLKAALELGIFPEVQSLTPRDILRTRLILHKGIGLPISIADNILDLAEYWARTTVKRQEELTVEEDTPESAYIETLVQSRLKSPVRKIVFYMRSHDQGWSDGTADHGTYRGSYTWFDAGATLNSGSSPVESSRLLIQCNVHASYETRAHIVTWAAQEGDTKKWMEALGPGDRICVYPKARYRGWRNEVSEVEMDLYCAWV